MQSKNRINPHVMSHEGGEPYLGFNIITPDIIKPVFAIRSPNNTPIQHVCFLRGTRINLPNIISATRHRRMRILWGIGIGADDVRCAHGVLAKRVVDLNFRETLYVNKLYVCHFTRQSGRAYLVRSGFVRAGCYWCIPG